MLANGNRNRHGTPRLKKLLCFSKDVLIRLRETIRKRVLKKEENKGLRKPREVKEIVDTVHSQIETSKGFVIEETGLNLKRATEWRDILKYLENPYGDLTENEMLKLKELLR